MYIVNIKSLNKRLKLDIPADTPHDEALEYAFKKLKETGKDPEALEYIGSKLHTSGWGKTIGGAIGSVAGAVGGVLAAPFTAGIVNPITGAVGGGAGGGAIGEEIEQYFTGRGDGGDVGKAALTEGAWGLLPAGGAIVKGGAKVAAKPIANIAGKIISPTLSRIPGLAVDKLAGSAVGQVSKGATKATTAATREVIGDTVAPIYDSLRKEVVELTQRKASGLTSAQTKRLAELKRVSGDIAKLKDVVTSAGTASASNVNELVSVLKEADGLLKSTATKDLIDSLTKKAVRNETVKNISKGAVGGVGAEAAIKGQLDQDTQDRLAVGFGVKGASTAANFIPFLNKGGLLKDKISKVYDEGYTAPGQAYAIAKSYQKRGLLR